MKRLILILLTPFFVNANQVDLNIEKWVHTPYKKNQSHSISSQDNAMLIEVRGSAGFLATPLSEPSQVREISIRGAFSGNLDLGGEMQGDSDADDFALRVGLIYSGERKLSWLQKRLAPKWLQDAFEFAPTDDAGIGRIVFYNFYSDQRLSGSQRIHPKLDLIEERFIDEIKPNFDYTFSIDGQEDVLGFWISTDGDDTGSNFDLTINEFSYE